MRSTQVIVIGAGLGGLAAAIRLAARGVGVRVLEQNATPGGKVNLHSARGYTFDTGASLLTMRHVVEDLFTSVGRRMEDYLELVPLDPICRYSWPDGARLDVSLDARRTEEEIARLAPADVSGYRRFLADSRRKYEVAERTFLAHSLNDLPRLLRPRYARDLAAIASHRTLSAHVGRYFCSPHLRQFFNRFATYNGSSPYRTPAAFALIPHVEFGLGAWYVRGGMYRLPASLARVAAELGVEFQYGAQVEHIRVERGEVRGVRIKGGETHACEAVVANSDALETLRRMIDGDAPRGGSDTNVRNGDDTSGRNGSDRNERSGDGTSARDSVEASRRRGVYVSRRLSRVEPSLSGFVLLAGARRRYPVLAHHNIFFSSDYRAEFRALFDEGRLADEPTIYVCAASRTDASQSPAGHENLFVLVNAPALGARVSWKDDADAYRDKIVRRLEHFGLEDLGASIDYERRITPEDFQSLYGAHRGSLYGGASHGWTSAFLRPPNRARKIRGLYFAGGTTHPGGGIPLVLLSGKMAAELLLADNAKRV